MDHVESRARIVEALDSRPLRWLSARLGYASTDYVSQMLNGTEPAPRGFYDDVAAILGIQPRDITPANIVYTFARLGKRGRRVVAQ